MSTAPVPTWGCCSRSTIRCASERVGKAPKHCPECKGIVTTGERYITTQVWRSDNRYSLSTATSVYRTLKATEKATEGTELVIRLVFN